MSEMIHPFSDKSKAILKYEPVELNGLVYHPITVADYDKWQVCRSALTLRQGALPAKYACMTYLQCVWALDYDARASGSESKFGPWNALAMILALSLRFSDNDKIQAIGNLPDRRNLVSIRIVKDEQEHDIEPMEFNVVRKLIAEQNGAELPNEADNPDLIDAAESIRNTTNVRLNHDLGDMLTSVASARNLRRKDLFDWPIKELDDEIRAIRRRVGHLISSIAEVQGAKYENGNPYPTWMFDRANDEFEGLISMSQLQSDHKAQISVQENAPTT